MQLQFLGNQHFCCFQKPSANRLPQLEEKCEPVLPSIIGRWRCVEIINRSGYESNYYFGKQYDADGTGNSFEYSIVYGLQTKNFTWAMSGNKIIERYQSVESIGSYYTDTYTIISCTNTTLVQEFNECGDHETRTYVRM